MKQGLKKAAIAGIAGEILYFISMGLFLITQTGGALTFWEAMTVAGAIIMLIVFAVIADEYKIQQIHHKLMLISLSGTVFLTSIAHFTSIGVIRKLESQGTAVPDYFKIGASPSIEMTIDYIAWGFFMGLAFIVLFLGYVYFCSQISKNSLSTRAGIKPTLSHIQRIPCLTIDLQP